MLEGSYAKWQRGQSSKPVHEYFGRQADCLVDQRQSRRDLMIQYIPTLRLDGKVVVITGGSKGLGRAMALGFAEAGADVVVSSRKLERLRGGGRRDPGDRSACARGGLPRRPLGRVRRRSIDGTVAEFGRIDVLVNNAGIAPVPPSLIGVTEELFDKTIDVNLKGPLRLTALAAEHMPPGGTIINISSKASTHPSPFTVVYAAAKAGLNALTKASAQEFAPRASG